MGASSHSYLIRTDHLIHSRCKVRLLQTSQLSPYTHLKSNDNKYKIISYSCHNLTSLSSAVLRILPNYCATYVLLAIVMIANPILYVASTRDLEIAVLHSMAQMTGRERRLIQTVRLKFALINLVYYVCWIPNLINGILLWTFWFKLPIKAIITLWYIMVCLDVILIICVHIVNLEK